VIWITWLNETDTLAVDTSAKLRSRSRWSEQSQPVAASTPRRAPLEQMMRGAGGHNWTTIIWLRTRWLYIATLEQDQNSCDGFWVICCIKSSSWAACLQGCKELYEQSLLETRNK